MYCESSQNKRRCFEGKDSIFYVNIFLPLNGIMCVAITSYNKQTFIFIWGFGVSKWITRWFGRDLTDQKLEQCRHNLYRLAYAWCNDAQLAEDLVQDTLMKAWQNREAIRQDEAEMAWLCRVLRNQLLDHLRNTGKAVHTELEDDVCASPYLTPEESCERADMVKQVRSAVSSLPLLQRQIITLVDLEGLSYEQVASVLDIPLGTVMSRLSRARDILRKTVLAKGIKTEQVTYMRRVK